MGSRTDTAANPELAVRAGRAAARGGLIQVAPGPELPDTRDKAGAQAGMALALTLGGAFWVLVAAAAIYLLRH
jgi:hypothetical protein